MKKKFLLIVSIFSFLFAQSQQQRLDTVLVRNLQMQAQDWAYLVAEYPVTIDSVAIRHYHRIREKIKTTPNITWTTNVTVDSLPGFIVMEFYSIAKSSAAGVIVNRYTAITNAVSGKTNLAYWIGLMDGQLSAEYNRKRDKGKNLLID